MRSERPKRRSCRREKAVLRRYDDGVEVLSYVLGLGGRVGSRTGCLPQGARKSRIDSAISSQCVSSAKWPVSKKRISAPGMSRLNASAPAGRKNGSFLPQTAKSGGLRSRK